MKDLTGSNSQNRSQMPPIPGDKGLETKTDDAIYTRLVDNPDSQPAKYRRLIRSEGKIERPRFDQWAEQQGFRSAAGCHSSTLLMLERIGEIELRGRGDSQTIVWVGE